VTSTHSSLTDLSSLYSDVIADIDASASAHLTSAATATALSIAPENSLSNDQEGEGEEENLWIDGDQMTWRTVPDTLSAPESANLRESYDAGNSEPQGRTSRSHSTIHPVITQTSTSFDLSVTRDLLSTLMTPLLIQIKGVISTAIDLYSLKKTRQDRHHDPSITSEGIDIDEVVLVGGSSLIPSIQQTVREILKEKNIRSFSTSAGGGGGASTVPTAAAGAEKEFCSSICPYETVVNGLAVKGALLSGVQSSILQDILMIDVTPSAIGILVWVMPVMTTSPDQEAREGLEEEQEAVFEPLIPRGTPLPCRVKKTYEIDERCLASGLLTLQLFEEIYLTNEEKISHAARAIGTAASPGEDSEFLCEEDDKTKGEPSSGQEEDREDVSFASLNGRTILPLGSYEVPIRDCIYRMRPPPDGSWEEDQQKEITGDEELDSESLPWSVDVELSMNAEGILSYAVCPPPPSAATTAASAPSREMSKESSSSLRLLSGYLCFLILLYLIVKLQFPSLDLPDAPAPPPAFADTADEV
jgi:hypothetical protein